MRRLRVLVACEFSGTVREAFASRGHDAWSCDLLRTERPGNHIQGDVVPLLKDGWDLLVAHPPCTYLTIAGARWFKDEGRQEKQEQALKFVLTLLNALIPRIAVENPVGVISTRIAPPKQIIEPYQFGHPFTKATCLWLKNLPSLKPTNMVNPKEGSYGHRDGPSPDRWKKRSLTFPGIAEAMADQWGLFQGVVGFGLGADRQYRINKEQ